MFLSQLENSLIIYFFPGYFSVNVYHVASLQNTYISKLVCILHIRVEQNEVLLPNTRSPTNHVYSNQPWKMIKLKETPIERINRNLSEKKLKIEKHKSDSTYSCPISMKLWHRTVGRVNIICWFSWISEDGPYFETLYLHIHKVSEWWTRIL